ncbi:MAG: hypothetical protein Q8K36_02660, partial [Alphaproteobacteria bacterium]|nr:hypothetical protein [Alphaproteobacteria bacterium]
KWEYAVDSERFKILKRAYGKWSALSDGLGIRRPFSSFMMRALCPENRALQRRFKIMLSKNHHLRVMASRNPVLEASMIAEILDEADWKGRPQKGCAVS